MRTTVVRVRRAAAAAAWVVLIAGCGGGVGGSAPTSAVSSASFGQKAVHADLDAAIKAAGLPGGRTQAGFKGSRPTRPVATAKDRKLATLVPRLTPCVVSWTSNATWSSSGTDPAKVRRQLDTVLSGLAARGWKVTQPSEEAPIGGGGSYFMATYKKQGWILNARHSRLQSLNQSTVMITEEACFGRLTDEELALFDDD
ncbi:hypothetical protein [Streptomyces sp. NBC_01800]|uniref:hypothetical protein n=1 Tax=Streptomyces sp. NBC_01800 TaxID=2975945 RepID=UPI002DDA527B|nr:hypothetical protein [Streptomyces sp. NBC_01800]WSA73033.1 hypothetical protein OIE65_42710 [Streptomyces sp. NBC_01800]